MKEESQEDTWIVNETASKLTLRNIDGEEMVLAPLQKKKVPADSEFDVHELELKGIVRQPPPSEDPSKAVTTIGMVLLYGGIGLVVAANMLAKIDPMFGIKAATWPYAVWGTLLAVLIIVVVLLSLYFASALSLVARWIKNAVALMVILAIGLGLPAATIYFFGGGRELLEKSSRSLALFGRLLQLALIATASLLPVLLFFLFDRYKLSTLRQRLYFSLFRLDRSVRTVSEIDAKYGSQIGEAYGSDARGRGRLAPGTQWPVLVCAFVMTLGWIVALAPVGSGFSPADAKEVLASLVPQRSATVFGFLGVYFFSLRVIALRYARGDLKPKAYTNIMVRLFIVLVISWVLEAVFAGESSLMLVLAFLFGITPDEFFTWLRQTFRKAPKAALPQSTLPLNRLEGIDLYDLARLESEGIVNIEGLAHHELIDLIIETRIPVPRLIDWVDQAILYLHLAGGSDDKKARTKLRDYGIRTATDLLLAWKKVETRNNQDELAAFKKLLGDEQPPPYRLEVIRDALSDDEWFATVSYWRRGEPHEAKEELAAPSSVEGLERMAKQALDDKRDRRALHLLKESLKIQDTAGVRRRIAHILATSPVLDLRDSNEARENAARAFELATPDDYDGAAELLEIYSKLDDLQWADLQCAEKTYELAVKILDNSSERQSEKEQHRNHLKGLLALVKERVKAQQPGPAVAAGQGS